MSFGDFPIIICGKYRIHFKENSYNFGNQLVQVLEVFWWNFVKVAIKFWRNLGEIEKKILNASRKIMDILLEKNRSNSTMMFLTLWENLRKFSGIISVKFRIKLRRSRWKTLKKYEKHFAQTWKTILIKNFFTFQGNFLKELTHNFKETLNNFRE